MHTSQAPTLVTARDIREGDVIRGYYRRGTTVRSAIVPDGTFHADQQRAVGLLARPYRAKVAGLSALAELRTTQRFTDDSPILVSREPVRPVRPMTPQDHEDFAEAIGKIAAFAATSLHESFPHLSLENLVETFTRASAFNMLGTRYLSGLERGLTPGEAAGEAGAALIRLWADARLEARAQLDQVKAALTSA